MHRVRDTASAKGRGLLRFLFLRERPLRGIADQALAAWVPTVEPQHVSGNCRLVDKYEVGRVKKALLANPASACTRHVGSLALRRLQTFF